MSVIAEYPGPGESLYQPGSDEAIWLTDLEGHADIYDNDSIKINYADWFDQSQIVKIEVRRNEIKMRFLPDSFDILTSEQMKTFDGNPLEHTPASNHTDHAIWGYEYDIKVITTSANDARTMSVTVNSSVTYSPEILFVEIGQTFYKGLSASDSSILAFLDNQKQMGFNGIAIDVNHFTDSTTSHKVYGQYTFDLDVHTWFRTATDAEIVRMIRLAHASRMSVEIRFQVLVAEEAKRIYGPSQGRETIVPTYAFWSNYTEACVRLASLLEANGDPGVPDYFTAFVELISLERYPLQTKAVLDSIDSVFSGRLIYAQHTSMHIGSNPEFVEQGETAGWESEVGTFFDWTDDEGRKLIVGLNIGNKIIEETKDTRFSVMLENYNNIVARLSSWFRKRYPDTPLIYGEMWAFNHDGYATQGWPPCDTCEDDDQEYSDVLATYLTVAAANDLDGASCWVADLYRWEFDPPPRAWWAHGIPASQLMAAIFDAGSFDSEYVKPLAIPYRVEYSPPAPYADAARFMFTSDEDNICISAEGSVVIDALAHGEIEIVLRPRGGDYWIPDKYVLVGTNAGWSLHRENVTTKERVLMRKLDVQASEEIQVCLPRNDIVLRDTYPQIAIQVKCTIGDESLPIWYVPNLST